MVISKYFRTEGYSLSTFAYRRRNFLRRQRQDAFAMHTAVMVACTRANPHKWRTTHELIRMPNQSMTHIRLTNLFEQSHFINLSR